MCCGLIIAFFLPIGPFKTREWNFKTSKGHLTTQSWAMLPLGRDFPASRLLIPAPELLAVTGVLLLIPVTCYFPDGKRRIPGPNFFFKGLMKIYLQGREDGLRVGTGVLTGVQHS